MRQYEKDNHERWEKVIKEGLEMPDEEAEQILRELRKAPYEVRQAIIILLRYK